MIRRIILFLWLLFVLFFAYRWYNKTEADSLLFKIKNLSFSKSNTYTTTVYDTNGSGKTITMEGNSWLLEKISDTMLDKTGGSNSTNDQIIQQILNQDNLEKWVIVPWISGKVITQTGPVETLSIQPITTKKSSISTTTNIPSPDNQMLSEEDKQEAENFSQLFSN